MGQQDVTAQQTTDRATISANGQSHSVVRAGGRKNSTCILVVSSGANPTEKVMEYAISVADRLGSKVILARVNPRPLLQEASPFSTSAVSAARQGADPFRLKAENRGVEFECIAESGKICKVVSRLCHVIKRVEFVVIDQGIRMEEVVASSPVPVFSVVNNEPDRAQQARDRQIRTFFHGETFMKATSRRTYLAKTLFFGAMTAALYATVFAYSDTIMQYWTKGGVYALLPVATVFVFSYAHGSFTGHFWSALGIEGSKASVSKPAQPQTTVAGKARKHQDTRPRAQVNA